MIKIDLTYPEWTPLEQSPREVRDALDNSIDFSLGMFGRITGGWSSKNRPRWRIRRSVSRGDWGFALSTDSSVFVWLNDGTSKRYATFDSSYKRKSQHRKFGSFGKGGQPLRRGKRHVTQAYAIAHKIDEAEWDKEMAEKVLPDILFREFETAFFKIGASYGATGRRLRLHKVRLM